jgi:hypothetical protein
MYTILLHPTQCLKCHFSDMMIEYKWATKYASKAEEKNADLNGPKLYCIWPKLLL